MVVWAPPVFAAGSSSSRVHQVKRLYKQLFFDDAMKVCQAVLDAGRNPRADLVQLLKYKGLIAAVQGNKDLAIKTFKRLLVIDPLVKLRKGHPPRVRRAFAVASRWFKGEKPLMVEAKAPAVSSRKGSIKLRLDVVSDPLALVSEAILYVRAQGSKGFRSYLRKRKTKDYFRWKVRLSKLGELTYAESVEYYIATLDNNYNEIATHGSAAAPHQITLEGAAAPRPGVGVGVGPVAAIPLHGVQHEQAVQDHPTPSPWYKRWWVWTVVGVVVTATAVTIGAAAGSASDTVDAPVTLVSGGGP